MKFITTTLLILTYFFASAQDVIIITSKDQISNLKLGDIIEIGVIDFTDPDAPQKNAELFLEIKPLIDTHIENLRNGSEDLRRFKLMCIEQRTLQEFKKEFSANRLKEIAREVGAKDEGSYSELMNNIKKEIEDSN